jgi:hypothetical protein
MHNTKEMEMVCIVNDEYQQGLSDSYSSRQRIFFQSDYDEDRNHFKMILKETKNYQGDPKSEHNEPTFSAKLIIPYCQSMQVTLIFDLFFVLIHIM